MPCAVVRARSTGAAEPGEIAVEVAYALPERERVLRAHALTPLTGAALEAVRACEAAGVTLVEAFALVRSDHVVRRGDHEGEIPDDGRVVPKRTERTDVGHGLLGVTARRPKALGTRASYDRSRLGRIRR